MKYKKRFKDIRYPNLTTILMVEDYLRQHPIVKNISIMQKSLPKKVMHQTLKVILNYLWESKKIEYTPEGIRWKFE